jgi:hypothetical protein
MVNEITFIVEELGGKTALGHPVHTREDMSAAIREGFPFCRQPRICPAATAAMTDAKTRTQGTWRFSIN